MAAEKYLCWNSNAAQKNLSALKQRGFVYFLMLKNAD